MTRKPAPIRAAPRLLADIQQLRRERDEARGLLALSEDAHGAVRRLLDTHGVPSAAFIDDHVGNAIWQRDQARKWSAAWKRLARTIWRAANNLMTTHGKCAFCGMDYGTIANMTDENVRAHAAVCPAHPLRAAETETAALRQRVAALEMTISLAQSQRAADEKLKKLIAVADSSDDEIRQANIEYEMTGMRFNAALASATGQPEPKGA